MYDLSTQTETAICTQTSDQVYPSIYQDKIVWYDRRNGDWDIYMAVLPVPPPSPPTVVLGNYNAGEVSSYTINATLTAGIYGTQGDYITITFPGETSLPVSFNVADVTINGTNPSSVDKFNWDVQLNLAPNQSFSTGTPITIVFDAVAGITNPLTPGFYQLWFSTSKEPTLQSAPYEITGGPPPSAWIDIDIWNDHIDVCNAPPNMPVTVEVKDSTGTVKGSTVKVADPSGWAEVHCYELNNIDIISGDIVRATFWDGSFVEMTVANIDASCNMATNVVSGIGSANSPINLWARGVNGEYQTSVTSTAGGAFSYDFTPQLDIVYNYEYGASYTDVDGNQTHVTKWTPGLVVDVNNDYVDGKGATPNTTVTVEVRNASNVLKASKSVKAYRNGDFKVDRSTLGEINIIPGDKVKATFYDSSYVQITVANITASCDMATNIVSGSAPANSMVHINVDGVSGHFEGDTTAGAIGFYSFDFTPQVDIRYNYWFDAVYNHSDGNVTHFGDNTPGAETNIFYDDIWGFKAPPNSWITVELKDSFDSLKGTDVVQADQYGSWSSPNWMGRYLTDIVPGDKIIATTTGYEVTMTVANLDANCDVETNIVSGVGPPNTSLEVQAWGMSGAGAGAQVIADTFGNFSYDFSSQRDILYNDWFEVIYNGNDGNKTHYQRQVPGLRTDIFWDNISGQSPVVNSYVNIYLYDQSDTTKAVASVWSNQHGEFRASSWDLSSVDVAPYDKVIAVFADFSGVMMTVPYLTAELDKATNVLSGDAPANSLIYAYVSDPAGFYDGNISVSSSGTYSRNLTGIFDVTIDSNAYLRYQNLEGNIAETNAFSLGFEVSLNPDYVRGQGLYPYQNVSIEVKNASNLLKGSGTVWTDRQGFFSAEPYDLGLMNTDMASGDKVYMTYMDWKTEMTTTVAIATNLTGKINIDTDTVSGSTLPNSKVKIEVYTPGTEITTAVAANSSGNYSYSAPVNIRRDDEVNVSYLNAEGNRVRLEIPNGAVNANLTFNIVKSTNFALPGTTVYAEVRDQFNKFKGGAVISINRWNMLLIEPWQWNTTEPIDLESGDTIYLTSDERNDTIPTNLTAETSWTANTVSGSSVPNSNVELLIKEQDQPSWMGESTTLATGLDGSFFYQSYQDIGAGWEVHAAHYNPDNNVVTVANVYPSTHILITQDEIYGVGYPVGRKVQVDIYDESGSYKGLVLTNTDSGGSYNVHKSDFSPPIDIVSGDNVYVFIEGETPIYIPINLTGSVDLALDYVFGNSTPNTTVTVEVNGYYGSDKQTIITNLEGSYFASFFFDIIPGDWIKVKYVNPEGNFVHLTIPTGLEPPIITFPPEGSTIDTSSTVVEGLARPNAQIQIIHGYYDEYGYYLSDFTTATADSLGNITATIPVYNGWNELHVTQKVASGEVSGPAWTYFWGDISAKVRVSGTVNQGGLPVQDAYVYFWDIYTYQSYETTSNALGFYSLDVPQGKSYSGYAYKGDDWSETTTTGILTSDTTINFAFIPQLPVISYPPSGELITSSPINATGTAFPGAQVKIRHAWWNSYGYYQEEITTTTADESGNWSKSINVYDGENDLYVSQQVSGQWSYEEFSYFFGDIPENKVALQGKITKGVTPQPDAYVYFWDNYTYAFYSAISDSNGDYLVQVPSGSSYSGYAYKGYDYSNTTSTAIISTTTTVNFAFKPDMPLISVPLYGQTFTTSSVAVSGTAVNNADIYIELYGYPYSGSYISKSVTTTANGSGNWSYTFSGLKDGSYNLYVSQKDVSGLMSDYAYSYFYVNLAISGTVSLSGKVTTFEETPVSAATVYIWGYPSGSGYFSTYKDTDAGGNYSFDVPQDTNYYLYAYKYDPSAYTYKWTDTTYVAVESTNVSGVNLKFKPNPPVIISPALGETTTPPSGDEITLEGTALANANIYLYSYAYDDFGFWKSNCYTPIADGSGAFTVSNFKVYNDKNDIYIYQEKDGMWSDYGYHYFYGLNVPVSPNYATVTGEVKTQGGIPIQGATVNLDNYLLHFEATTDAQGKYTIKGVPYSNWTYYTAFADKKTEGYMPSEAQQIWISQGTTYTANFILTKPSSEKGILASSWNYRLGKIDYRMVIGASPGIGNVDGKTANLETACGSDEYWPKPETEVVGTPVSGIWRLFRANGNLVWARATENDEARSSVALVDVDGDKKLEIVGGTTSGSSVEVIDQADTTQPTLAKFYTGGFVHSSPAVADLDPSNPGLEIVATSYSGKVYCLGVTTTTVDSNIVVDDLKEAWSQPFNMGGYNTMVSSPAIEDIDGNGKKDVVFGTSDGYVYVLNSDGTLKWKYKTGGGVYASPALFDVDGDGNRDVIIGSSDTKLYAIKSTVGGPSVLWTYKTGGEIYSSPAVADIDLDGIHEIVVGSNDGKVYAFELNGTKKWEYNTGKAIYSSPAIAYRNYDGSGNVTSVGVYVGSENGDLYLLDGADGKLIDRFMTGAVIRTSPAVADTDGDKKLEVLFQDWRSSGDLVWCLEDASSTVPSYANEWPQFRYGPARRGVKPLTQVQAVTPPPLSPIIKGTNPASPSSTGTVNVFGISEAGTLVELFDGTITASLGTTTATVINEFNKTVSLSEGSHTLKAKATDTGTGLSSDLSLGYTVVVDKTAPIITITGVTSGTTYGASGVTPVISICDVSSYDSTTTLNGATFVSGTKITAGGAYTLVVTAKDGAGNTSSKEVTFGIDDTPPITTLSIIPDSPDGTPAGWYATTPTVNMSRSEPGSTYYQWDSTSATGWKTYSTSITGSSGVHTLYYFSKDIYGNKENTKSFVFKVGMDNSPPVVNFTYPPAGLTPLNNKITYTSSVTVTANATDTGLGVAAGTINFTHFYPEKNTTCCIATIGSGITQVGDELIIPLHDLSTQEGLHILKIDLKDMAGNSTQATSKFYYKATPPSITLSTTQTVPGDSLGIDGSNFIPKDVISLYRETAAGASTLIESTTASASGSFSTTVTVPSGLSVGTYNIVARGSYGTSAQASFNVNLKLLFSPPSGTSFSPSDNPKIGVKADSASVATVDASYTAGNGLWLSLGKLTKEGSTPWYYTNWSTGYLAEGTYTVLAEARDKNGSLITTEDVTYTIKPDLSLELSPANLANVFPDSTLMAKGGKDVSTVLYQVQKDGVWTNIGYATKISGTSWWQVKWDTLATVSNSPGTYYLRAIPNNQGGKAAYIYYKLVSDLFLSFTPDSTTLVRSASQSLIVTGGSSVTTVTVSYKKESDPSWTTIGTKSRPTGTTGSYNFTFSWNTLGLLTNTTYTVRAQPNLSINPSDLAYSNYWFKEDLSLILYPADGSTINPNETLSCYAGQDVTAVTFEYYDKGIWTTIGNGAQSGSWFTITFDTSQLASGSYYQVRAYPNGDTSKAVTVTYYYEDTLSLSIYYPHDGFSVTANPTIWMMAGSAVNYIEMFISTDTVTWIPAKWYDIAAGLADANTTRAAQYPLTSDWYYSLSTQEIATGTSFMVKAIPNGSLSHAAVVTYNLVDLSLELYPESSSEATTTLKANPVIKAKGGAGVYQVEFYYQQLLDDGSYSSLTLIPAYVGYTNIVTRTAGSDWFETRIDTSNLEDGTYKIVAIGWDASLTVFNTVEAPYLLDTHPPKKPNIIEVTYSPQKGVEIHWADPQNQAEDRAGYNIYRAESTPTGFQNIAYVVWDGHDSSYFYNDWNIQKTTTYYYYVTAVDTAGNESDGSEIKSITVHTLPDTQYGKGKKKGGPDQDTTASAQGDSYITVSIPKEALHQDVIITLEALTTKTADTPLKFELLQTVGSALLEGVDASKLVGSAYSLLVMDAQTGLVVSEFDSPITITIHYTEEEWQAVKNTLSGTVSLYFTYYHPAKGKWVSVQATQGTDEQGNKTLTVQISHATLFGLTAGAIVAGGFGGGGGAAAPSAGAAISRLSGTNRYETAVLISRKGWSSASTVIIATGKNFPDALAGAPLAKAYNAPILLTEPGFLPSVTKNEINRLKATKAIILGGTGAVSDSVKSAIISKTTVNVVERVYGSNRYETAAAIARKLKSKLGSGLSKYAIIATGENYPDALAVSGLAGYKKMAILLVTKNSIPSATSKAISDLGITRTIIVGGTGVVSSGVKAQLPNATRLAGTNRYETAREIAEYAIDQGMSWSKTLIATGANYPDALAGGALAAKLAGPMLLVHPTDLDKSPATKSILVAKRASINYIYLLGGTGAVSTVVQEEIDEAVS